MSIRFTDNPLADLRKVTEDKISTEGSPVERLFLAATLDVTERLAAFQNDLAPYIDEDCDVAMMTTEALQSAFGTLIANATPTQIAPDVLLLCVAKFARMTVTLVAELRTELAKHGVANNDSLLDTILSEMPEGDASGLLATLRQKSQEKAAERQS